MFNDICTCEVSLTDAATLSEWDAMILGYLAHGQTTPVHLAKVVELAPHFAMAHAAKGLFSMMMGRRELSLVAQQASMDAQAALKAFGGNQRERLWCTALDEWIKGYPSKAIQTIEEAMRVNPADTLSMKVSHAIRFMIGDNHGMRRSIERAMGAHGEDHALRGYALGCLSFSLEETGSYQDAEHAGLLALQLAKDDAWGLHAVTHVYDTIHCPDQGIKLIDQNTSAWSDCNNFRFHVWWHKAVLHLDQGQNDLVLELYDTKIRNEKTDDYRDFSNASSLLLRLELEGVDVGDRWGELADLAEARSEDGCLVFADLHYILALSGDNRHDAAARLIARVVRDSSGSGEMAHVMKAPGVAAAEGLAAFGEARYDLAFVNLITARSELQSIGGSHAQRDVFERIVIDAGLRAGYLNATEQLVAERTKFRNGISDSFAETRQKMIADARVLKATVAAD